MDPRHLQARVREAKIDLWTCLGGAVILGIVSLMFVPAFAGAPPILGAIAFLHYRRYRSAKRKLARFNKPPTARLLP
jgi:hypothetical protein